MNILISQIFHNLWLNKLRSSLAIFCIAFGVFIMVMLMALGDGFCKESARNIMRIADNSLAVSLRGSSKSYQGYPKGQTNRIAINDVVMLPKVLPDIEMTTPMLSQRAILSYRGKAQAKMVWGVTPGHMCLAKLTVEFPGRFIKQIDIERQARVVVLSSKARDIFYGKASNPIGTKFLIDSVPFTVIGVLSKEHEQGGFGYSDDVYISYKSYEELYAEKYVNFFFAIAKPGINSGKAEQMLRSYFGYKYHFDKNDKEAMFFWGSSKLHESIRWFLIGIQLFLFFCGLMILAVGSIGVANIMFLIIAERTYEIGLRKAIGAKDQQIFCQLFFEVLMIMGGGGILGLMAAFFTTAFLQNIILPGWLGVPTVSWITALIAIFVLTLVGLVTSFFPARRAAEMDPIEALLS